MAHVGIFGATLCGKTTLAKALAARYAVQGRRSICLLAFPDAWGPHCWTTQDPDAFRRKVQTNTGCAVFIEEAASTINRDRSFMGYFTAIRHGGHRLHVLGHSGTDLLPGMRRQLTTLFLFQQGVKAAAAWAEEFPNPLLVQAAELDPDRYEFIHAGKRPYTFGRHFLSEYVQ
jgi:hypothetical protein